MANKDVRLITKKEAIKLLENIDNVILRNIISSTDIKQEYGDIVYLGWSSLNSNSVTLLEASMIDLEDQELSYRLTIIGNTLEEIEELYYTAIEDDKKNIPYPSVIRTFDEKDMEEQLKGYNNYINKATGKEMDEYEPNI